MAHAQDLVVSVHPLSTAALAPLNVWYGKISFGWTAWGVQDWTAAVSGFHSRRDAIEERPFSLDSEKDTVDYTRDQVSLWLGKRIQVYPLYIQPTLQLGWYRNRDRIRPSQSVDGPFTGALVYFGKQWNHGRLVYGFDLGAGARLTGRNRFDVLGRLLLDADASLGLRF